MRNDKGELPSEVMCAGPVRREPGAKDADELVGRSLGTMTAKMMGREGKRSDGLMERERAKWWIWGLMPLSQTYLEAMKIVRNHFVVDLSIHASHGTAASASAANISLVLYKPAK